MKLKSLQKGIEHLNIVEALRESDEELKDGEKLEVVKREKEESGIAPISKRPKETRNQTRKAKEERQEEPPEL